MKFLLIPFSFIFRTSFFAAPDPLCDATGVPGHATSTRGRAGDGGAERRVDHEAAGGASCGTKGDPVAQQRRCAHPTPLTPLTEEPRRAAWRPSAVACRMASPLRLAEHRREWRFVAASRYPTPFRLLSLCSGFPSIPRNRGETFSGLSCIRPP